MVSTGLRPAGTAGAATAGATAGSVACRANDASWTSHPVGRRQAHHCSRRRQGHSGPCWPGRTGRLFNA